MTTAALPLALVRAVRPRQWSKNLLVAAAPLAAGVLLDTALTVLLAFIAFTAAASATYLINDVRDAPLDRQHPRKRHRPIASGELPPALAITAGILLGIGGLVLAFVVEPAFGVTLAIYIAIQAGYVLGLKNQPVLDLAIISSGFLLRAIAGAAATDLPVSQWFLLVTAFGSLFVVTGKRYSELYELGSSGETRATLSDYSESYLRFVWGMAATITAMTYSLWAFEIADGGPTSWQAGSIAPFVLAIMRYGLKIDRGVAGEPEETIARDPVLLALAAAWLATFSLGVW